MISNANDIITWSESYTTWNPVYLLPHLYRKCICGLSSRVQYVGCAHEKLAKSSLPMPNKLFCCWLMFDVVYWIGWLKCEETRHICNLRSRGLSNMWKHHTQPQQPVTSFSCWSLAWSPTAVGWDPILQVTFVASQPMWLWDQLVFQHEKQVDLTSVQWGWSQDCRQAILNKSTGGGSLSVISEDRLSYLAVEIRECQLFQDLISISLCIQWWHFSSEDNTTPQHNNASTKSSQHSILHAHFDLSVIGRIWTHCWI